MRKVVFPRAPAIFGFADGMTCAAGIVVGMLISHQPAGAVWVAAFSAGLAEFAGMTSGQLQSAPEDGKTAALVCGLASLIGAVFPAVPYLVTSGGMALAASVAVTAILCGIVAYLRPEKGWRAYGLSYGITAAACCLCVLGGLIR